MNKIPIVNNINEFLELVKDLKDHNIDLVAKNAVKHIIENGIPSGKVDIKLHQKDVIGIKSKSLNHYQIQFLKDKYNLQYDKRFEINFMVVEFKNEA